jgi:hypothetical protein
MNDEPRQDEQIIEAFEAYRPGHDDPSDPALTPLIERLAADSQLAQKHQRLQRLDAALGEAVRDVPVPEGLAQRLLDRLDAAAKASQPPGESVKMLPSRRMTTRRRWLVATTAGAVAASLAVGAFFALRPGGYTEAEVLDVAVQLFDAPPTEASRVLGDEEASRVLGDEERLGVKGFPLGSEIAVTSAARCRPVRDFLGRKAVAYELTDWAGARATLYVVQCDDKVADLDAVAPQQPTRTTGNRAVAAWQTGGLLYVLVVEGDSRTYRGFLKPNGPLA